MRDAECVTGFAPHNRGLYMQQQASYFLFDTIYTILQPLLFQMPRFPAFIDNNSLYWLFQHGMVEKSKPVRPYSSIDHLISKNIPCDQDHCCKQPICDNERMTNSWQV
jgi:hypothetical protein